MADETQPRNDGGDDSDPLFGQDDSTAVDPPRRFTPKKIGRYTLRKPIASGGMGTVYLAVQESPHRTVALKVMKAGIASKSALRRFEYESQILGRLRHPNIAQVYEAGTHDDGGGGVPYFAMEYVPNAKTLIEYAEAKQLGTRERLELFGIVCDAVHHGHQKGIIHRDLKPGNILVDSSGAPKIIDFGVARATDSDLAVTTLQTDVGQLIGTLQYMSPEQCEADPNDLDTRSDVYALGVVLYELLTGALPYDVSRVALYEAARVIREDVPAKLSAMNRALRGDVETITLKSLEKDRDRRYQSAADLANDVDRYLRSEVILARRPGPWYRCRKFWGRHPVLVVSTGAVLLLLVAAILAAGKIRSDQRNAASIAHSERLAVLRMAPDRSNLDEASRSRVDDVVDATASRLMAHEATEQEARTLVEVLQPLRIRGRPLQEVAQPVIWVDVGCGGTNVRGLGLELKARVRIDGAPVTVLYPRDRWIVKLSSGPDAFGTTSCRLDAALTLGGHRLHGDFEARFVEVIGQDPEIAEYLTPSMSFRLPEFSFTAVAELPSEYPPEVVAPALAEKVRVGCRVDECKIHNRDGGMVSVEFQLHMRRSPMPIAIGLTAASSDGSWTQQLSGAVVLVERKISGFGFEIGGLYSGPDGGYAEVRFDCPRSLVDDATKWPLRLRVQSSRTAARSSHSINEYLYMDFEVPIECQPEGRP